MKYVVVVLELLFLAPFLRAEDLLGSLQKTEAKADWHAGPSRDWFVNFNDALNAADKRKIPMLVVLTSSDQDKVGQRLESECLTQREFQRFAHRRFVLLYINLPRREIPWTQRKHNNDVVKLLGFDGNHCETRVVNSDLELLGSYNSFRSSASYISALKDMLKNRRPKSLLVGRGGGPRLVGDGNSADTVPVRGKPAPSLPPKPVTPVANPVRPAVQPVAAKVRERDVHPAVTPVSVQPQVALPPPTLTRAAGVLDYLFGGRWQSRILVVSEGGKNFRSGKIAGSLESYRALIAEGVDVVRIRVHASSDGVFFVYDEKDLEKRTDGTGLISEHASDELRTLRFKDKNGTRFETAVLPTLEEVLDIVKGRLACSFEIGTGFSPDMGRRLLELLTRKQLLREVYFKFSEPLSSVEKKMGQNFAMAMHGGQLRVSLGVGPDWTVDQWRQRGHEWTSGVGRRVLFSFSWKAQHTIDLLDAVEELRTSGTEVFDSEFHNPEGWDKYVQREVLAIVSWIPGDLLRHLRARNLHD